ncbi:bile acid:sodium symporter family protein [Flavobacterium sp. '19STA2R22 D10 B1']|uniref:bile acid:sodium symporter family protein n=1 Tax=Flavobacterium aerium TaxID=3037261 RepID=UPI00278C2727|nr:bile acid:sodium symporter family protein [Flavobacterium sp. '19STA2R22 D10 B1']
MKFKLDKFVLAIIATVCIAYLFPNFGADDSWFPIDTISGYGISLIFFFYGLKLSPDKIKSGLKNWKLHILVQSATFIIFPLVVLLFYPLMKNEEQHTMWLAVFFLAALPSTVSSSVVMVSIAKGNIPAAIFNASLSGIIGILLTPLWMKPFLEQQQADFNFEKVYTQLIFQIIIPVILGIILQRFGSKWAQKYNSQLSFFDKAIILLIVYKSFAESFISGIFKTLQWYDMFILLIIVSVLFWVVYGLINWIAKRLGFNREDRITASFCGSKKSLVHGTVMSKVLFTNAATIGIILLPLMLYHAMQILVISIIAGKLAKEVEV